MELVNTSPVAVGFSIAGNTLDVSRTVMFTAKATFKLEDNGQTMLERDVPLPLLNEDQSSELGLYPTDIMPKLDPAFEVMMLGMAYAPDGQAITEMQVALSVGGVRCEMDVIGERVWQGEGESAKISPPEPFMTMPLTWQRAYGGTQQVLIDREASLDVNDPMNSDGKGMDHITRARELGEAFQSPEGYPQFDTIRPLPNLELPSQRVDSWSDTPLPVCWAPVPLSSGLIYERFKRSCERRGEKYILLGAPEMLHRAHPDWVIEPPVAGAEVRLEGLTRQGLLVFRLPEIRVVVDFKSGDRVQEVELVPRSLMLLPEEKCFYLTFRATANFESLENEKRVARVRLVQGWCPAETGAFQ